MRQVISDNESPDFYQRLLAAGKPKKLALTPLRRKPPTILNAMLKPA